MCFMCFFVFFFFFKQKTAYEMRISDWSLDVCSSDLHVTVAEASIRKAKGLKADEPVCYACHGPIAEMEEIYQFSPLTMKWCVDCHRETEVIHAEDNEYYDKILAAHEQMKEGGVTVADLGGHECARSEERSVGNECVSTSRTRGSP